MVLVGDFMVLVGDFMVLFSDFIMLFDCWCLFGDFIYWLMVRWCVGW